MTQLDLIVPESALSALRRSPSEFAGALKLAAAIHWYQRGVLSQERAAELAGLNRRDFKARSDPATSLFRKSRSFRPEDSGRGSAPPRR